MTIATVSASTMGTLIAGDAGGPAWSGVPNGAQVLGTAIGATVLSMVMARFGHRAGLLAGYVMAAVGALIAALGAAGRLLPVLVAGILLVGIGNGGSQLGRYAAGELYPPARRSFALGIVVWGGTAGALVGPGLLGGSSAVIGRAGLPSNTGPYLLALLVAIIAGALTAGLLYRARDRGAATSDAVPERIATMLRRRPVVVALTTMVAAQVAMVGVMTMTPLQMHMSGYGMGPLIAILTVHMVGMFALSPLTGRLADRIGGTPTALAGLALLLIAGVGTYLAPMVDSPLAFGALFLLGYGWNVAFVGGSSLLSSGLGEASRTRLQGVVDGMAWTGSAVASVAAGMLMDVASWAMLGIAACAVVLVPVVVIAVSAGAKRRGSATAKDATACQESVVSPHSSPVDDHHGDRPGEHEK